MTEAVARKKRSRAFDLVIEVPAIILTFVMMLHITINALLRTYWSSPINNTLEMVQYWYLPLVAFLGFVAAQHRGQHIATGLIYDMLPHAAKRIILAVLFTLGALITFGFTWFGWGEAMHAMSIGKTAGVSDLVSWPVYFVVPLAFGSLTIQLLYTAWSAIRPRRTSDPDPDPDPDDADDAAEQREKEETRKAGPR